jgi:hypothetical protein
MSSLPLEEAPERKAEAIPITKEQQEEQEEDDPRWSSAALCIQLSLLDHPPFRPHYTHQCFSGEVVRGYQPYSDVLLVASQLHHHTHKSYAEHDTAKYELQIQIHLSPSCQSCSIELNIRKKRCLRPQTILRKNATSNINNNNNNNCMASPTASPDCTRTSRSRKRLKLTDDNNEQEETPWNVSTATTSSSSSSNSPTETTSVLDAEEEDAEEEDEDQGSEFDPDEDNNTTVEEEEDDDEEYVDDNDEEEEDDDNSILRDPNHLITGGTTRHRRLSPTEIVQALAKALPNVVIRNHPGEDDDGHSSSSIVQDDYLTQPMGVVLQTYTRQDKDYCITLADGKDVGPYHTSVQRLALFYIENADDVDITSQDGGYWKVLYLFQKHYSNHKNKNHIKYSLAGYMTLFHFTSPFRKPVPGTIVRICQAVILPPYQRCGHGRTLLHCVHKLAQGTSNILSSLKDVNGSIGNEDEEDGSNTEEEKHKLSSYSASIVEINVEDPAPGFVALRNLVDYEVYWNTKEHEQEKDWFDKYCQDPCNTTKYFTGLSETDAKELSRITKLTVPQMQIVYEMNRLHGLQQVQKDISLLTSNSKKYNFDDLDKQFRLMVKKRLNREYKEELSYCRTKDSMKRFLDQLYMEQRTMYDIILRKVIDNPKKEVSRSREQNYVHE